jgi:hypothetical protein
LFTDSSLQVQRVVVLHGNAATVAITVGAAAASTMMDKTRFRID